MSSSRPRSRPAAASADPALDAEADLGGLAVDEVDPLVGEPGGERRRGRRRLDVDERRRPRGRPRSRRGGRRAGARGGPGRASRTSLARTTPVTGPRRSVRPEQPVGRAALREAGADGLEPAGLHLDRVVGRGRRATAIPSGRAGRGWRGPASRSPRRARAGRTGAARRGAARRPRGGRRAPSRRPDAISGAVRKSPARPGRASVAR